MITELSLREVQYLESLTLRNVVRNESFISKYWSWTINVTAQQEDVESALGCDPTLSSSANIACDEDTLEQPQTSS